MMGGPGSLLTCEWRISYFFVRSPDDVVASTLRISTAQHLTPARRTACWTCQKEIHICSWLILRIVTPAHIHCSCWCFWSYEVPLAELASASWIYVRAMDESMNTQPRDMYAGFPPSPHSADICSPGM